MTVFENVVFGLWARRDTKDLHDRVRNALHTVHLEDFEKRYSHQPSGGQRQRVAFAPTGALLSPTSSFQGESVPGICHAVVLSHTKEAQ